MATRSPDINPIENLFYVIKIDALSKDYNIQAKKQTTTTNIVKIKRVEKLIRPMGKSLWRL